MKRSELEVNKKKFHEKLEELFFMHWTARNFHEMSKSFWKMKEKKEIMKNNISYVFVGKFVMETDKKKIISHHAVVFFFQKS